MEKKRILFFIYQMGGGGAARTLLNIVNNIDRSAFTPILVTLDHDGDYEEYLSDDVTFIKLGAKRLRGAVMPLSKVIRNNKIDLVFSTIPNYNIVAILSTVLSGTKAKNVVREAAFLGGRFKEDIKLVGLGMLYQKAAKVIALSKGVKSNIIGRYKVKPDKIDIIYNPVDIESIQRMMEQDDVTDAMKQATAGSTVLITAGRLVLDKDHETLIKAFKKVQQRIGDVHLIILGEGALEDELKQLTTTLGITASVHFAGFEQNPYAYFKHADLFVLSSTKEGFGHVLTEALATGTPVVSTNARPGAAEVLKDGMYGKMCSISDASALADSIHHVLTLDDDELEAVIDKGKRRAQNFHVDKIVRQYEQMFAEVLDH